MTEVSREEYASHLESVYRDPEAVAKILEEGVGRREEDFRAFEEELKSDRGLDERMASNPVGTLRERGLLGPYDQLRLDLDFAGGIGPIRWPWPCRIECHFVFSFERRWICIRTHGLIFCYPVLQIVVRRVCRLICW